MSRTRDCPDCRKRMEPIKIVDATQPGLAAKGAMHVELAYAAPDAKPSAFLRAIPREGRVTGLLCPECGAIRLFGEPLR